MVKVEITPIYVKSDEKREYICEVCGSHWKDEGSAKQCEARGFDESTKIPIGTIVAYQYETWFGDSKPKYERRIGMVYGHEKGTHRYMQKVIDIYDLWTTTYDYNKDSLEILMIDVAEKELADAFKDKMDEIELLKNLRNGLIGRNDVEKYLSKEFKYGRRG